VSIRIGKSLCRYSLFVYLSHIIICRKTWKVELDYTKKHIERIKNNNPDLRRGSIYEIIFSAAFHIPPMQVVEMLHPQAQTYDLIVSFKDNTKVNISVKNFGNSEKDQMFLDRSKNMESIISKTIPNPLQVIIYSDQYPSKMDWDNLARELPKALVYRGNININGWHIVLIPLNPAEKRFYEKRRSYTLFITAQYYSREESRIYKSLEKACSDIEKNGRNETDKEINILCIHLPPYVNLYNYAIWCKNYLTNDSRTKISGMRLIQPALAVDPTRDKSFLAFSYKDVFRSDRLKEWFNREERKLYGEFAVGVPSTESLNHVFNPTDFMIPKKHYLYQSGHIYYLAEKSNNGNIIGESRFDYGIHTHIVVNLFKQDTIWSGKFPPTDELLIL
jgi:hypothetical protein